MRIIARILMICFLAVSNAGAAEELFYIGSDQTGTKWYIIMGANSKLYEDNSRSVWIHANHIYDKTIKARTSKALYKMNCDNNTLGVVTSISYDSIGRVIENYDSPDYLIKQTNVIPGTIGSVIFNYMCKGIHPK